MTYLNRIVPLAAAASTVLTLGTLANAQVAQDTLPSTSAETSMQTVVSDIDGAEMVYITPVRTIISTYPAQAVEPRGVLSPAEIRNAVLLEVDRLKAAGIDIDPTSLDGVGADARNEDDIVQEIQYMVENTLMDPDWIGTRL